MVLLRVNLCGILVLLFFYFTPCYSAKSYLFKKCEQNGFCNRNRHFAFEIDKKGDDYESRYAVDLQSLNINDKRGYVGGLILKQLNDGSFKDLTFQITILENNDLRLKIDEKDRKIDSSIKVNHERYNEASKWAFGKNGKTPKLTNFTYQLQNDQLILQYGNDDYKTLVDLHPFRITVYYKGLKQITVNDRNFLNVEHYRTKESEEDPNSIDVTPEESTFNAYSDDFKDSKSDSLPLGPESIALDFTFNNYLNVYGIPEHADSLSLKDTTDGEPYRLYNVDIFEYEVQSKLPMYGSIPFMVAVNPVSSAGIFWINSADTYIDISKQFSEVENAHESFLFEDKLDKVQTHWMSENGIIDVVLMVKSTPKEISHSYGLLTGFTTLPNLFSLGYHQCRWNYNDEIDVLGVHYKFEEYGIPYDTIWLDIEYTDDKKYFTWKSDLFPNPDRMMAELALTGHQLVTIVDPHLKEGYHISDIVVDRRMGLIEPESGITYYGHCWPGLSVWIDTLNPNSVPFWIEQFSNGSSLLGFSTNGHIWNDMNEPSIFNGPETSAPKDLMHYDNWEHRSVHNLYGLTFHEATYQALIARNSNQRPFILTRAFFAGSQRTAAMWTGDNMARWEYLRESIPMVLTMNVAGFPFAGADVGGFFGNPEKDLLVRWYQTGIWYPFFRGHAHIDSRRREPWIAGGEYTDHMRDAIKLRYKILPIIYTEFFKNSISGKPILSPLSWEVQNDVTGYEIDDEFYLGGLLVKPVVDQGKESADVYFPCDGETYFDFFNLDKKFESCKLTTVDATLDQIPVFVKGGSIITLKERDRRSSKLMRYDPYTFYVVFGENGKAHGELYIDDGETFGYENGDYIYVELEGNDEDRRLTGKIIDGDVTKQSYFVSSLDRVTVNKIIVVGSKWQKEIGDKVDVCQGEDKWAVETIISGESFFTIRKPAVKINESWEIRF